MPLPLSNESLSCLIAAYLGEGAQTRELLPSTIRTWGPHLRSFLRWYETHYRRPPFLDDWHPMPIRLYSAWLQTKPNKNSVGKDGLRPRTVINHLAALHAVGKWLVANNYATYNPVEQVDRPRIDQAQRKFMEPEEVDALLAACERLYPPRHKKLVTAVVSVYLCTGMRYEDVRGLKMRNVLLSEVPNQSKLVAEHSKGDKEFVASLPDETVEALHIWLAERGTLGLNANNDWLWTITASRRIGDHWWKEVRQELQAIAGIDLEGRFQAHVCRRAFATHLEDQNTPLSQIQEALGHENPETTALYLSRSRNRKEKYVQRQGWKKQKIEPTAAPGAEPVVPPALPIPEVVSLPQIAPMPALTLEQEKQLQEMQMLLRMMELMKNKNEQGDLT